MTGGRTTWIKAGIEYSDGQAALSSVLTLGKSDWATGVYSGDPGDFMLRATMTKGTLKLQVSADGIVWPLLRLCPFPQAPSYFVGPMCCTPERAGLEVEFSSFKVEPPMTVISASIAPVAPSMATASGRTSCAGRTMR